MLLPQAASLPPHQPMWPARPAICRTCQPSLPRVPLPSRLPIRSHFLGELLLVLQHPAGRSALRTLPEPREELALPALPGAALPRSRRSVSNAHQGPSKAPARLEGANQKKPDGEATGALDSAKGKKGTCQGGEREGAPQEEMLGHRETCVNVSPGGGLCTGQDTWSAVVLGLFKVSQERVVLTSTPQHCQPMPMGLGPHPARCGVQEAPHWAQAGVFLAHYRAWSAEGVPRQTLLSSSSPGLGPQNWCPHSPGMPSPSPPRSDPQLLWPPERLNELRSHGLCYCL